MFAMQYFDNVTEVCSVEAVKANNQMQQLYFQLMDFTECAIQ